jgi:adenosylhomocysteine nucleosidase
MGRLGQTPAALLRTGVGAAAMTEALSRELAAAPPGLCLHLGYCAGAVPALGAGELIVAAAVISQNHGGIFYPPADLPRRGLEVCRRQRLAASAGTLLSVPRPLWTASANAALAQQYDAVGIDLESAALAALCQAAGAPYLVVRAVLDPLEFPWPSGLADSPRKQELEQVPGFKANAALARGALAAFLQGWAA